MWGYQWGRKHSAGCWLGCLIYLVVCGLVIFMLLALTGCRTPSGGSPMEATTEIDAAEGAIVDATTDMDREEGTVEVAGDIAAPVTTHRYGMSPEALTVVRDLGPEVISVVDRLMSGGLRIALTAFGVIFGWSMVLFWVPSPARKGMWWLYGAGIGLLVIGGSLLAGFLL